MFAIEGKVALISGALGGIGMCYTKELLRHNVKGLSLLDINDNLAKNFLEDIEREFGNVDVIFIKVDVTVTSQITDAYEKTIGHFNQLDIVINNAGIIDEHNVEKTIKTNLISVAVSTNLAMNIYLQKYRGGEEGVVVNTASLAGVLPIFSIGPIYSATKYGVIGLGRCLGVDEMYQLKKVKVLTVCPGRTQTSLFMISGALPELVNSKAHMAIQELPIQSPEHVANCLISIIAEGKTGSVWGINGMKPAKEIDYTEIDSMVYSFSNL